MLSLHRKWERSSEPAQGLISRTLLIVDDEPKVIGSIRRILRNEEIDIITAGSGPKALEALKNQQVGVVLSDQNMPAMDGISFLEKVREYDNDIVRILLTGYASVDSAKEAIHRTQVFELLTKPWDNAALIQTVRRAFRHHELARENKRLLHVTRQQNRQLRHLNDTLEKKVSQRTQQLVNAVRDGILMLSLAAEAKDDDTGDHVKRIKILTEATCAKIGVAPKEAERIGFFSMMHDVGKIHIPDRILKKPGRLSPQEWDVMKRHTIAGEQILGTSAYYEIARQIARSHHEWMDGSGYPDGLKGNDIPLPARVVAVVDVFDALTHERVYKKAWPKDAAVEEIIRLAGKQFDPNIVDAFVALLDDG